MGKHERWVVYPALIAVCVFTFMGQLPMGDAAAKPEEAVFDRIVCRHLVIVSDKGNRTVAELRSNAGVGFLVVNNDQGKPSSVLTGGTTRGPHQSPGGITFLRGGGIIDFGTTCGPDGLTVLGVDGRSPMASVGVGSDGCGQVTLSDTTGRPHVIASADPKAPGLTVVGTDRTVRAHIRCISEGSFLSLERPGGAVTLNTVPGGGLFTMNAGKDSVYPELTLRCDTGGAGLNAFSKAHGVSLGTDAEGGFCSVREVRGDGKLDTVASLQSSAGAGKVELKGKGGKSRTLEP